MEKLRSIWIKVRWYALAVGVALVVVAAALLGANKGKPAQKMLESLFKRQKKLVQSEVERKKQKEQVVGTKIEEIDTKLKELDEKQKNEEKKIDTMDLKELADAWKTLGL